MFDQVEMDKFRDFVSRINHQGGSESYYLHFLNDDKWVESRIIEEDEGFVVTFKIFSEKKMIMGNILEI